MPLGPCLHQEKGGDFQDCQRECGEEGPPGQEELQLQGLAWPEVCCHPEGVSWCISPGKLKETRQPLQGAKLTGSSIPGPVLMLVPAFAAGGGAPSRRRSRSGIRPRALLPSLYGSHSTSHCQAQERVSNLGQPGLNYLPQSWDSSNTNVI